MELVCPAGSLPALKAAVDNGADCVYLGFATPPTRATLPA
jgi:collagenase-like PrtC family protease